MLAFREKPGAGTFLPFRASLCCGPERLSFLSLFGAGAICSFSKKGGASVRSPHSAASTAGTPRPSASPRHKGSQRGFTLLEVLIALGLLAILSAALYGTFFTVMRGRDAASAAMADRRELRNTLDMLRREIEAAIDVKYPKTETPQPSFTIEDRDFFGKPACRLTFNTISPPRSGNQPISDQTKVSYIPIQRGDKIVLAKQVKDVYVEGETAPYPLMENIEGFLVEWKSDKESDWKKTYQMPSLPKFVRVTIKVVEGNQTVAFTTVASPKMAP